MYSKDAEKILEKLILHPFQLYGNFEKSKNRTEKFYLIKSDFLSSILNIPAQFIIKPQATILINKITQAPKIISKIECEFSAYYLPHKLNTMQSVILKKDGDIFLTNNLSGCTVLVVLTDNKETKVYHLNAQDEEGNIDQNKINKMMATIPECKNPKNILFKLEKADYDHSDRPIIVLGFRRGDHWSFHYQIFSGKEFTCHDNMTLETKNNYLLRKNTANDTIFGHLKYKN